jgi:hypothetical protein
MAGRPLNLLELPTGGAAEFGAGAEVVRLDLQTEFLAVNLTAASTACGEKGGAGDRCGCIKAGVEVKRLR